MWQIIIALILNHLHVIIVFAYAAMLALITYIYIKRGN